MSSTSETSRSIGPMENLLSELVGFGTLIAELERYDCSLPQTEENLQKELTNEAYHAFMSLCPDAEATAEVFAQAVALVLAGTLAASAVPAP